MKKKNLVLMRALLFGLMLPFVFSCDDDDSKFSDVDGGNPIIDLVTGTVRTEVQTEFQIVGTITDRDGLRSIQLVNKDIYLDKTINLLAIYDELQYEYELDYKFSAVNADWEDEHFDIKIIATDTGNRSTEETFRLSLDGDVTPPVFTTAPSENITVLIKEETTLNLRFSASDNKGLDYVEYSIPAIGVGGKIEANGLKTLDFSEKITLPSTEGEYDLSIRVVDCFDLEVSQECVISVSELPDFERMYLADVATSTELNSDVYGVPMYVERTGEYTYTARYYSEKAGTEICFIPQKTDFYPICFGLDPGDNTHLTDDPDMAEPIILPEVGYYEIVINTLDGYYSVEKYTPTDEPLPIGENVIHWWQDPTNPDMYPLYIGLAGEGIPNTPDWTPHDTFLLEQDKTNPFILYQEMNLTAGNEIMFTITMQAAEEGWWNEPFWRFDAETQEEANVLNGGENMKPQTIPATGKYMFKFDTHLLRSKIYRID